MIEIASIKIGTIFTNAELMEKFGVSNSGGMRRSLKNNLLIYEKYDESNQVRQVVMFPHLTHKGQSWQAIQ